MILKENQLLANDNSTIVIDSNYTGENCPIGSVIPFCSDDIPDGYFLCDGSSLNKYTYFYLYQAIDYTWGGSGDTFRIPDLRGYFIRSVDHGAGRVAYETSRIPAGNKTPSEVGSSYTYSTALPTNNEYFTGSLITKNNSHSHSFSIYSRQANHGTFGYDQVYGLILSSYSSIIPSTGTFNSAGNHKHSYTITDGGDLQTFPCNIYINYIIRFE